ncbi:MAG TPA: hypothetical protein VKM72_01705 [Thermoanaerobaculia bacterium]|nr:hypothetical protein [Thermoanaerobaculia bacterium]
MPSHLHLLLVILAGYLFVHACDYLHYRAKSLEGHRLVIEASVAGFALFVLVRPFMVFLKFLDTLFLGSFLQKYWFLFTAGSPYSGTLLVTILLATPLALGWNLYQGYRNKALIPVEWTGRSWRENYSNFSKALALEEAIDRTGNSLLLMLHEAATRWSHDFTMLGVTMSDRKLYVGWAFRSPQLTQHESYFALFPLMSGYRDDKTLKPVFNFFYPLESAGVKEAIADPYRHLIILPLSGVSSARLLESNFDPEELAGLDPDPDPQQELAFLDD